MISTMRDNWLWILVWLCQCHVLAYSPLSDDTLQHLLDPGDGFDITKGRLLAPILQPRVPGTPGSTAVLTHFIDFFRDKLPGWSVTFQNSTFTTPISNGARVPFVNFIATRDPPGTVPGEVGRLVLVAHYDSKLEPKGFIGATDSAAPCAMIMHVAQSIDSALTKKWADEDPDEVMLDRQGVQILLLDGEEAFKTWSDTDSIYGARALATEWEQTLHPAQSTYRNPLDSIDLFVLLDLLGAEAPSIPSYYKTTHWAYRKMASLETRLRSLGLFESHTRHPDHFLDEANKKETDAWNGGHIGDDHVPFLAKGVEILHLIALPFPDVWHTIEDDGEHLHLPTVRDWAKLVTAFVAEWMDLEAYMSVHKSANKDEL